MMSEECRISLTLGSRWFAGCIDIYRDVMAELHGRADRRKASRQQPLDLVSLDGTATGKAAQRAATTRTPRSLCRARLPQTYANPSSSIKSVVPETIAAYGRSPDILMKSSTMHTIHRPLLFLRR